MNQKKWIYITLGVFLLSLIEQQLIFAGIGPLNGFGALVLTGMFATLMFIVLVIQVVAYVISKKRKSND